MKTNRQGNKSLIENETWRVENILVRAGKAARLVGRGLRTMLFPFQLPRTRCNAHCHPSHTITSTHTHTHMLRVHSAKRSPKVRSTTVSASFSDLNAPTCALPTDPGGKYQLTNLSPRAPKLCKSAICRGTTAACRSAPECQAGGNAGSAKSASARPELSKIGRESIPVHRTSSKGEVELKM